MVKLRKMLGDINSKECKDMMELISSQSHNTLSKWSIDYVKNNCLPIYEKECPNQARLKEIIILCEENLKNNKEIENIKDIVEETRKIARTNNDNILKETSTKALTTAIGTIKTPTNALGFLFYAIAAITYNNLGLNASILEYESYATKEFKKALESLQKVSIKDEIHPVKIKWNC